MKATERLRHNARESVKDKFTVARLAADIDLLYRKLLAEKGFEDKLDVLLRPPSSPSGLDCASKTAR